MIKIKKICAFLLALCFVFSLCGCDFLKDISDEALNPTAKSKTFEFEGISIELTTDFTRMNFVSDEYDFVVSGYDVTVCGVKTTKDLSEYPDFSVKDYAETYCELLEADEKSAISEIDGIPTMTALFEDTKSAIMFYKAEDCFWVVNFAADLDKFDDVYDQICSYAKTVKCK